MMRKNQKGQALIEFVLVLPVLILLVFGFIDLGRIILENNRLENVTTLAISKYKENYKYDEALTYVKTMGYDDIELSFTREDNLLKVNVNKNIDLITPGLDKILGDSYDVKVERVVNYE